MARVGRNSAAAMSTAAWERIVMWKVGAFAVRPTGGCVIPMLAPPPHSGNTDAYSGVALAPLLKFALAVSPAVVPQALLITCGLFGTMTALSMAAKPGATLRWGVPLAGGMIVLMGVGLASFFVPVTSAWQRAAR